eukprot:793133-Rhodomonas_salina.1
MTDGPASTQDMMVKQRRIIDGIAFGISFNLGQRLSPPQSTGFSFPGRVKSSATSTLISLGSSGKKHVSVSFSTIVK